MNSSNPFTFNLPDPVVKNGDENISDMGTPEWRALMMKLWEQGAAVSMPAQVSLWAPSGGFIVLFDFLPVVLLNPENFPLLTMTWPWCSLNGAEVKSEQDGRIDPFKGYHAESAGVYFGKALELWVNRLCPDWMDTVARTKLEAPRPWETWRRKTMLLELNLRPHDPEAWSGSDSDALQILKKEIFALRTRRVKQAHNLVSSLGASRVWHLHGQNELESMHERSQKLWDEFIAERERRLLQGASVQGHKNASAPTPRI